MTRKPPLPQPPEPPEPPAPPGGVMGEPERKERVIHTRVPESLEAELRKRAGDLGISVSNLVRNVLGHAFGLVGDVVADSHAIARAARGERDKADAVASASGAPGRAGDPADVLAWQAIVLARNAVCARCNALLPRGDAAAIGFTERGDRCVVCTSCLEELQP